MEPIFLFRLEGNEVRAGTVVSAVDAESVCRHVDGSILPIVGKVHDDGTGTIYRRGAMVPVEVQVQRRRAECAAPGCREPPADLGLFFCREHTTPEDEDREHEAFRANYLAEIEARRRT